MTRKLLQFQFLALLAAVSSLAGPRPALADSPHEELENIRQNIRQRVRDDVQRRIKAQNEVQQAGKESEKPKAPQAPAAKQPAEKQ